MRTSLLTVAALAVAAMVTLDGRALAVRGVHGYRVAISPLLASAGVRCRFEPTCSRYAEIVVGRDGLMRGGWKTLHRIARCGPWTKPGTVDEP